MTAYEIPNLRFSMEAGATVARRRFVKPTAAEKVIQATAAGMAIGVSSNETLIGEVLEIYDGIVMIEAGGAIAAADPIESDGVGRAITRNAGIMLGIALTAAAAAGELIAMKMPTGHAVTTNIVAAQFSVTADVENLAAGADIADRPIFVVPVGKTFTVLFADIVSQGAPAGIDAANTCAIAIEVGATVLANKTFTNVVIFPTSDAVSLGAVADGLRVAGDVITFSVTNGATADPPAFIIQLVGTLEDA